MDEKGTGAADVGRGEGVYSVYATQVSLLSLKKENTSTVLLKLAVVRESQQHSGSQCPAS